MLWFAAAAVTLAVSRHEVVSAELLVLLGLVNLAVVPKVRRTTSRFYEARRVKVADGHLLRRPLWNAHRVRIPPRHAVLHVAVGHDGSVWVACKCGVAWTADDEPRGTGAAFRHHLRNEHGGAGIGLLVLLLGFMALILLLAILGLSWLHTFGLP